MSAGKRVYTTVTAGDQTHRIGAQLEGDTVHVWIVDGPAIGGYRITRFEGERLTAATLRKAVTGK